jgi:hypothetical protein
MIYNIATGQIRDFDAQKPNKTRLPLRSTNYDTSTIDDLTGFTGGPLDLNPQYRYPTIADHGSQPSSNTGVYVINENNFLIK